MTTKSYTVLGLMDECEQLEKKLNKAAAALDEAHRYFRNRVGNEEQQLNDLIGAALRVILERKRWK